MVELELAEALVGNAQPRKDAAPVARPNLRPDRRRDRVRPAQLRRPALGIAPEHGDDSE